MVIRNRMKSQKGASSIEFVLYSPVLFLTIFLIVQAALTWHGNQIASAVARETARDARTDPSPEGLIEARQEGLELAEKLSTEGLNEVTITFEIVAGGEEVRTTVRGRSIEIIGGLSPWVEQTVQSPIEEFKPDQ
jgi:Flp pilus assembly protein TadG